MKVQVWSYPIPADGELVPDYPPALLGEAEMDAVELSVQRDSDLRER